jgi:hypothetical protein
MAVKQTKKVALVKGRRLRVTRLDSCGRVEYGDDAVVTSSGFISVGFTASSSSTDEINVTNASGETIVHEASVSSLTGYGVELVFGEVDPELFALITGQDVVLDADGNPSGFDIDTAIVLTGSGFALEVWAGAPAGDACEDDASQGTYGYLLLPFLQGGLLGDFTVENGGISFTISGANTHDGNAWGKGPYNVMLNIPTGGGPKVPGPMVEAVSSTTALRVLLVDVAPPDAETGSRPLLDPSHAAITSVTPTTHTGTLSVDFAVAPDPDPNVGCWYEFGDGTFEWVETNTDNTTHVYAIAGTYTVMASTNGVWRTATVTVPGV